MLSFERTIAFERDLKKLAKKWRSLSGDIVTAEKVIAAVYGGSETVYEQFFATPRATVITRTVNAEVVKMRLDCKSLGNDKKTRIVFVMIKTSDKIVFVELFAKNNKERESQSRYLEYLHCGGPSENASEVDARRDQSTQGS